MKKSQREKQRGFYKNCLERAIREENKEDILYYTKQLKLMELVDYINDNFN